MFRSTCLSSSVIALVASTILAAENRPDPPAVEPPPVSADPRLVVELFAAAPDIVHPIAVDFDSRGRMLVVESHTHFRPAKYEGPKHDRVRVLEDTNGDGKADRFTTFFEGTTATMDLAVHPDGSVYLATRNEVLRLRDKDGDGVADEKTRIAFLDTAGNYPHNGLSGLAFDSRGDLIFGMGENLGATYKLNAADGTSLSGGGEGGNVFWCTKNGGKLRRVATGFWNPFGTCRDIFGRVFVVDNDPDSSPPCRMMQLLEGADYGFQFRYGRSGRGVFQAWNGELPGTLPMVAGTGESPCEVISYESDGLPSDYRGHLLVPAWADHRVERYVPRTQGAGTVADRKPFIQGGKEFRPSGLTVAPDGSLFVTDWVSRSYELHGKGAVWHIRSKEAKNTPRPTEPKAAFASLHRSTQDAAARSLATTAEGKSYLREQLSSKVVQVRAAALTALADANDDQLSLPDLARKDPEVLIRALAVRLLAEKGQDVNEFAAESLPPVVRLEALAGLKGESAKTTLLKLIADTDPYLRHTAIQSLAKKPDLLLSIPPAQVSDPKARVGLLLALRASGRPEAAKLLGTFLEDADPDVRFLAAKWVSDERLAQYRPQLLKALKEPQLDSRGFLALTTANASIMNQAVSDDALATFFLERLADRSASVSTRTLALKGIPANHAKLKTEQLLELLQQPEAGFRIEVLRALKERNDPKTVKVVQGIFTDSQQPLAVRTQALLVLASQGTPDGNFFVPLAGDPEPAIRQEALRALVQTKLSDEQRNQLLANTQKHADCQELVQRVLGKPFTKNRPQAEDIDGWLKFLDGPADADTGRRIFENTRLGGCYRCHRLEGRGHAFGPDLSLIGRTERRWIVESLLQPSSVVAPHYQAWKVDLVDGRSITGLLVRTYLDESYYVDSQGVQHKVEARDVAESNLVRGSIMPDKLQDGFTDQELRDLVAYLASRK